MKRRYNAKSANRTDGPTHNGNGADDDDRCAELQTGTPADHETSGPSDLELDIERVSGNSSEKKRLDPLTG